MELGKYILLYYRKLSGRISEAEADALEEAAAVPESDRIGRQLSRIWEGSEHYGADFEPDLEAGLQRLRDRIDRARRKEARVRRLQRRRRLLAAAAALLLLVLAGWWGKDLLAPAPDLQIAGTAAGEKHRLELPDGTVVTLNEKSRVAYPASFRGEPSREVRLTGEAFFEVASDPGQPFIIHTSDLTVRVVGTAFNLRTYEEESFTEVEVVEGRVRMRAPDGQSQEIGQQERGLYFRGGAMEKTPAPNLNARAWQTGNLRFHDTPVPGVLQTLERHFRVRIALESPALIDCTFNGNFDEARLDNILQTLELVFAAEVTQPEAGVYRIRSGQCR